ncbi:hypothetical protein ACFVT5_41030 [Streptomyces sp. NPDC058001]|uniref:hypothetical protein n=1 Tax=Streptomyces sp. NPDC058001 TaxID=3346300 RepID=UPI0036E46F3B
MSESTPHHGVPMYPISPCDCEIFPCGGVDVDNPLPCRTHRVTMSFHPADGEMCQALAARTVGAPRAEAPPRRGRAREMNVWDSNGRTRAVVRPDESD